MKIRKNLGFLIVIISMFLGIFASIFFNYGETLYTNEGLNDYKELIKVSPEISATHTTPILIDGDATGVGAHNWTWAKSTGICNGSGFDDDPYLIADDTFNVTSGTALTIVDSHDDYFKIENCIFLNPGNCHIKFDNVLKGFIINCSFTSKNYAIDIINSQQVTVFDNNFKNLNEIAIRTSQCSYINISDNNIHNSKTGIYLGGSEFNLILDNTLYSNMEGIELRYSDNNTVSKNSVLNNSVYGIILFESEENDIINNKVRDIIQPGSNIGEGIRLQQYSDNNNVSLNSIQNNERGIHIWGGEDNEIIKNTVQDNKYFSIRLYQCYEGNEISNNTICFNGGGIDLVDTDYAFISYNNITYNSGGISISGVSPLPSSNNTMFRNTISYCNSSGIDLFLSSENLILENTISYNNIGVEFYLANDNNVTGNFFICNNNHTVEQDSVNFFSDNYYEDCPPEDEDGDKDRMRISGYYPLLYIYIIIIGVSIYIIFLKRKKI